MSVSTSSTLIEKEGRTDGEEPEEGVDDDDDDTRGLEARVAREAREVLVHARARVRLALADVRRALPVEELVDDVDAGRDVEHGRERDRACVQPDERKDLPERADETKGRAGVRVSSCRSVVCCGWNSPSKGNQENESRDDGEDPGRGSLVSGERRVEGSLHCARTVI